MTSMRNVIVRIALAQMTLIVYSVLGMAVLLKVFHGSSAPDIFAKYVRDWGFLYLFISAGWCVWAVAETGKPEADHRTGLSVLSSGVALAAVIAAVAFVATISVVAHHSPMGARDYVVMKSPTPGKPSIINRRLPPDP